MVSCVAKATVTLIYSLVGYNWLAHSEKILGWTGTVDGLWIFCTADETIRLASPFQVFHTSGIRLRYVHLLLIFTWSLTPTTSTSRRMLMHEYRPIQCIQSWL